MIIIVVTGPSGSGKTFLANKISKDLNNCIVLKTDSYYKDNFYIRFFSLFIKDIYDRFISISDRNLLKTIESIKNNEENITYYNYKFNCKKSSKIIRKNKNNTKYLIVEGIFSHRINLNYKNSTNILCIETKEICFKRRLRRDQIERGRTKKEVNERFSKSWNLFFKHLHNYINSNHVYEINSIDNISYKKLIDKVKNNN
tara:strand:- start:37 stop:636 length:600 start_codon:yes stop_codon:yes gene_type:complete